MSKPPSNLAMIRDALIVAVIAVLTVQGLRKWYGDRYLVPSGSMEPFLYGHPVDGDMVFVDKFVNADSVGRGDLVVVQRPMRAGHQLVKRIACSGDEKGKSWIDIINGDIYLGDSRQHLHREVKDPSDAMRRSVTWALAGGSGPARASLDMRAVTQPGLVVPEVGPWLLPPCATKLANVRSAFRIRAHQARHRDLDDGVLPTGMIGTNQPVNATFVDLMGVRSETGDSTSVVDCGVEMEFVNRPEVVLCSIDSTDFTTTFVWNARGNTLSVWLNGTSVQDVGNVLSGPWQGKLTFGRLDGRDFVMLDDTYTLPLVIPGTATSPLPRTWLHVGVVGETTASIRSLRVFHDIFATRGNHQLNVGAPKWPVHVEPGHWFLLGDNCFNSTDSRRLGAQPTYGLIGVPTYVLGPWLRARRLCP
ncbi:MAG: hypothetical protein ACJAQZ_001087 [Planctomycetota bacterium]|jgi:hypothetical protein